MKRCGDKCGIFAGKDCKAIRDCGCECCASLEAVNMNLAEACYKACNTSDPNKRPKSKDEFLCKEIGGRDLFNIYKIIGCNYDPKKSIEKELADEEQGKIDEQNKNLMNLVYIIVALIVGVILYMIFRKK